MKNIIILSIGLVLSLFVTTTQVLAEDEESASVNIEAANYNEKGYFYLEAEPGETIILKLNVENKSNEMDAISKLFVSDVYTAKNGGLALISPDEATREAMGSWFAFEEENITLSPTEKRTINVEFTVPEDVSAGFHASTINSHRLVTDNTAEEAPTNQAQLLINQAFTQSIAIVVKVAGEVTPSFQTNRLSTEWNGSDLFLNIHVENTGNVPLKPTGSITLYKDEQQMVETTVDMDMVYSNNETMTSILLPNEFKEEGTYTAKIAWNYYDEQISDELDFEIEQKEVNQATEVEKDIAKNEGDNGLLVLTKEDIIKYAVILVIGLVVVIGIVVWVIRRKNKRQKDLE